MKHRITIGAGCAVVVCIIAYLVYAPSITPPAKQPTSPTTAPPAPVVQLPPKDLDVITNSIGMKLVYIDPGEFLMGSPANDPDRRGDEVQHRVTLTQGFRLGIYEVTQGQWTAVMNSSPSEVKGDDLPVSHVSWDDAVAFCSKLSELEGRQYSLPTEAQWEYACRAGTTGAFSGNGNLDDMGWYKDNADKMAHPVGQKTPNAWGLYDMYGNVYEWSSDWHRVYPPDAVTDPVGPPSGSHRILRGGGSFSTPWLCRSASRNRGAPAIPGNKMGFRVALKSDGTDGTDGEKDMQVQIEALREQLRRSIAELDAAGDKSFVPGTPIHGRITQVQTYEDGSTSVQLDIGSVDGVTQHMKFYIHREGTYMGTVQISVVDINASVGRVEDNQGKIVVDDQVLTAGQDEL
jgi:formylglycine-generating enzyme required for sulfatase activity